MKKGVCLFVLIGICVSWASAQFLNNRPFPTYSLENMPDTDFTCRDKILGGYYADAETQCQMFHVCVKVAGVGIQDFRFLCPNGTAFDQDHQICADWEDVDCDATTLYYSSDNFDLYRIGSGFESKAVKYGEDEETFALQRAETGDVRLNREHQTQRVNQQKELTTKRRPAQQNHDRDIFKTSSSSNFYNNRNNGKEEDDDNDENGDDNVNANQDRDPVQKRKLIRKQQQQPQQQSQRRPVDNQNYNNNNYNQQQNNRRPQSSNQENRRPHNRNNQDYQEKNNYEAQTYRPQRPAGFTNNFAGSSYIPTTTPTTSTTTSRPSTTTINDEQYTTALNNYRSRNGQRSQYNEDNSGANTPASTVYKVSTPAPFRQTQQYSRPTATTTTTTTTQAPQKETENYPSNFPFSTTPQRPKSVATENYQSTRNTQQYSQYESSKVKQQTENYPTTPFQNKKPSSSARTDNYPTTAPPKTKSTQSNNYPSTFSPRTNAGYSQINQQTTQYKPTNNQPTPFKTNQQSTPFSTPRTTQFTQYTPTVPKITTTTPVPPPRSNRYDETQYDDGSYDTTKYQRNNNNNNNNNEDEFLKTAHSQNIANSRNELLIKSTTKSNQQQSTQKPQYESPRPFSVTTNTPTSTPAPPKNPPPNNGNNNNKNTKKVKDVSYDYAYYDTNVGSEPEYDIDTDIKKAAVKN